MTLHQFLAMHCQQALLTTNIDVAAGKSLLPLSGLNKLGLRVLGSRLGEVRARGIVLHHFVALRCQQALLTTHIDVAAGNVSTMTAV